jgi:hypothetical protein
MSAPRPSGSAHNECGPLIRRNAVGLFDLHRHPGAVRSQRHGQRLPRSDPRGPLCSDGHVRPLMVDQGTAHVTAVRELSRVSPPRMTLGSSDERIAPMPIDTGPTGSALMTLFRDPWRPRAHSGGRRGPPGCWQRPRPASRLRPRRRSWCRPGSSGPEVPSVVSRDRRERRQQ